MKLDSFHFPYLPGRLERLGELAYNLWFSWHSEAIWLFKYLDEKLWEDVYHNPVKLLHQIDPLRLDALTHDNRFLNRFDAAMQTFDEYLKNDKTWFSNAHPDRSQDLTAYFCMEFGIHESLPIYSGGLGILAGDHLKSASDLGVPLVGVGLLYRESYFTQYISQHGHQQVLYIHNDYSTMAIRTVQEENGAPVIIRVPVADRTIAAKVWVAKIGRINLYLLDTDFPENPSEDRNITERLYVADRDLRLIQEILLGVGGVLALQALGLKPAVYHMNEGHSAFLSLELIRQKADAGTSMEEAFAAVKKNVVFTTHTPIAAGNETFDVDRIVKFMSGYSKALNLTPEALLKLGQADHNPDPHAFSMSILSFKTSRKSNGVSQLHGEVSRGMWQHLWHDTPVEEIPITAITNGVHARTWLARPMKYLLDCNLGTDWRDKQLEEPYWEGVFDIPDEELWKIHMRLKTLLIQSVRRRLVDQRERNGESADAIEEARHLLDPNRLTIGFARRFAPYKRGTLLFKDRERLRSILKNTDQEVQILFAGKAHPANQPGQTLIKEIYDESRSGDFNGHLIFVENYDMALARRLVAGVDVWLNTPRRPLEASGTSGMKAAMNGALNLSILDGWWCEGYNEKNGWAIGENRNFYNEFEQDDVDSHSLYHLIENEILPLYYKRNEKGLPASWIQWMKQAMRISLPKFNTLRMVKAYVEEMYLR